MATDAALLSDVPWFQDLDADERAELAAQVDVVTYPEKAILWRAGDPGGSLLVVRSGEVEVFYTDPTGQRTVLERVGPGGFFGDISLLDGGTRTASVVVMKDLVALRVDQHDLELLIRKHPLASLDILAAIGRRLRTTAELLRRSTSRNINLEIEDKRTPVQRVADWIAAFSGSITFLALHILIFFLWIILNVDLIKSIDLEWVREISMFDPFPFGLLTMVVSLEAIVLSVLVLLSQNRQSVKDRLRSDVEYQVNLKAEMEVAELHVKIDDLRADLLVRLERIERPQLPASTSLPAGD